MTKWSKINIPFINYLSSIRLGSKYNDNFYLKTLLVIDNSCYITNFKDITNDYL